MRSILFWVAALVVVTLLRPVLRLAIAALAGKQIGAAALAKQPDSIHLQRGEETSWKNGAAPRQIATTLLTRGFEDAGVYTVAELPGLVVQLFANASDRVYAATYEHPKVGQWLEIFSRYQDGTSATCTTSSAVTLNPRPGHPSTQMPGAQPLTVLQKALSSRPQGPLAEVSAARAVDMFEKAYADGVAYRKQVGVSRMEVVKTAARRAA